MLGDTQSGMEKALSEIEECIAGGQGTLDKSMSDVSGLFTEITGREKKSLGRVADLSSKHSKCLEESAKSSLQIVSELGETINEHANSVKPDLPTGQTPAKRAVDLPKSGFLQSLCTPAPEIVLEEYRSQKETRGTQTPTKEESAEDLDANVDAKENEDEVQGTPTKGGVSITTEAVERSPLSAVTNSPSIGLCN